MELEKSYYKQHSGSYSTDTKNIQMYVNVLFLCAEPLLKLFSSV